MALVLAFCAASAVPALSATLFAPGVTAGHGWYDTTKAFNSEDSDLCWAATASNLIAWWLDTYERGGGDLSGVTARTNSEIFMNFQKCWKNVGYNSMDGVAWYFTGKFSSGTEPEELEISGSGGYLSHLENVGTKAWGPLNGIVGDWGVYSTKTAFLNNMPGSYYPDDPLYSHESFSETIRDQLALGAVMLSVHKANALISATGHSITLWGCDYDETTGLVTKIYVTDSDDKRGGVLRAFDITTPSSGNGVLMEDYWVGDDQYGRITATTMLYAAYIPEPATFGLFAGTFALGLVASRRRRNRR